jgi:hypothetical protein
MYTHFIYNTSNKDSLSQNNDQCSNKNSTDIQKSQEDLSSEAKITTDNDNVDEQGHDIALSKTHRKLATIYISHKVRLSCPPFQIFQCILILFIILVICTLIDDLYNLPSIFTLEDSDIMLISR